MGLMAKIFGTRSQRELKKIQPLVDKILRLEEEYKALTDEQLQAKPPISRSGFLRARLWTTSCRRLLRPFGRLQTVSSVCAPIPFSSSAASCCTRAALRK